MVIIDPRIDFRKMNLPQITELHFQLRGNKLNLRANIRAIDIQRLLRFELYVLVKILKSIADKVKKDVGKLVVVIDEPYVYE